MYPISLQYSGVICQGLVSHNYNHYHLR